VTADADAARGLTVGPSRRYGWPVEIRGAAMPDEPGPGEARARRGDQARRDQARQSDQAGEGGPVAPVDSVTYRVDGRLLAVKVVGVVIFALVALGFHADRPTVAFAGLAALVAAAYALRDLIAPTRLSADREGLTVVAGYAGHHRLSWDEVEQVRVDERRRLGTRSNLVEIDCGERLYLLSSYDLSAHPQDVVDALDRLRPS
jgi:hypothetical protein